MVPSDLLRITLPITIGFGLIFWLMIFLNTYRHFPKMNPTERLWMCIESATMITLILMGVVYLFLWFILQKFIA